MRCIYGVILTIALCCPSGLLADEPKEQKPELLPAPKAVAPPEVIYVMPNLPQPGTREVWQYYGVDGRGRFVNRVMYTPSGAFDLRTGLPYPWTTTRPTLHMPYALD